MNKLTKAAIAGGIGVALLLGGAGTLASWNSSATLGAASTTINAGSLALTPTGTPGWTNAAGTAISVSSNALSYKIVPGDVLTYTATYNVAASGDNLFFTVTPSAGALTSATGAANTALLAQTVSAATFTVTGGSITPATSANTYKVATGAASTIVVKMTVTFGNGPGSAGATVDNSAQLGAIALGAGAVTLTQVATA